MVRRSKRLSSLNQTAEEPQPVRTEQTQTDAEVEDWVSFYSIATMNYRIEDDTVVKFHGPGVLL